MRNSHHFWICCFMRITLLVLICPVHFTFCRDFKTPRLLLLILVTACFYVVYFHDWLNNLPNRSFIILLELSGDNWWSENAFIFQDVFITFKITSNESCKPVKPEFPYTMYSLASAECADLDLPFTSSCKQLIKTWFFFLRQFFPH